MGLLDVKLTFIKNITKIRHILQLRMCDIRNFVVAVAELANNVSSKTVPDVSMTGKEEERRAK